MSNMVFPALPGLAWGETMAPGFSTAVKRSASGREVRAAFMAYPLWNFTLSYEFLRDGNRGADLKTIAGFFLAVRGQYDSFLYSATADNAVTAEAFGQGDGTTKSFQLTRSIGGGGFSFVEPVQNVNGSPSIYVGGVLKAVTTDYTISSTGVVTFTTAPANAAVLSWSGAFYYRCRFTLDSAEFSKFMSDMWELKKLSFIGSTGDKV